MLRIGHTVAIGLFALFSATPSFAEIEKVGAASGNAIELRWWPKISAPKGWHQEKESSFANSINIVVPDGETFAHSEYVIYARAVYKPRSPGIKSLDEFVANDKRGLLAQIPDTQIITEKALATATGRKFLSLYFKPKSVRNWERVTYGEEGDFFVLFTLSSRTEQGYLKALKTYKEVVGKYR